MGCLKKPEIPVLRGGDPYYLEAGSGQSVFITEPQDTNWRVTLPAHGDLYVDNGDVIVNGMSFNQLRDRATSNEVANDELRERIARLEDFVKVLVEREKIRDARAKESPRLKRRRRRGERIWGSK